MNPIRFEPGLYVAATPIGHLGDITERVRQALAACTQIYAEDTRRAQLLLTALGLHRARGTIHALHEHNEGAAAQQVLRDLQDGASVLLISDAGTPAISDPGFRLVNAAWQAGYPVRPLPGASALTAALSVCGFARWPICFWGFAPARRSARLTWLKQIKNVGGLAVLYEAPHRAEESLADCAEVFGSETPMLFGRELTKQFETLLRSPIRVVQEQVAAAQKEDARSAKGEMVWVFDLGLHDTAGTPGTGAAPSLQEWAQTLGQEMSAANAAKCLVKMLGVSRKEAYAAVLAAVPDRL
jgi:16S rRNA (cytidine1402-2'-O)-methyltransferase